MNTIKLILSVLALLYCSASSHDAYRMGVLRKYPTSACEGSGTPYFLPELIGYENIARNNNIQLFPEGLCSGFELEPLQFIRIDSCSEKTFQVFAKVGCYNEVQVNRCGEEAVVEGGDFYDLSCETVSVGEVIQFDFGCNMVIGRISFFAKTRICASNEEHSFQFTCDEENQQRIPGYRYYENDVSCFTSAVPNSENSKIFESGSCLDIKDIPPVPTEGIKDLDYGGEVMCHRGVRPLTEIGINAPASIGTIVTGISIVSTFVVSTVGAAIGMTASNDFPVHQLTQVLFACQFTALIGQMNLPFAPEYYMSFSASFGWSLLDFNLITTPKVGQNNTESVDSRRLILSDLVAPLQGMERYANKIGIQPQDYFINTILVFLIVVALSLTILAVLVLHRKKSLSHYYGVRAYSLGNALINAWFYPIFMAACYQISLKISDKSISIAFTAVAGVIAFIFVLWVVHSSVSIMSLDEEDMESKTKKRIVYRPLVDQYVFSQRLFWLVTILMLVGEAAAVIFVKTTPYFIQPAVVLGITMIGFISLCCFRPHSSGKDNMLGILIAFMYVLSSVIPVVFAVEPVLFSSDMMELLGKVELGLNLACIAITVSAMLMEIVPTLIACFFPTEGSTMVTYKGDDTAHQSSFDESASSSDDDDVHPNLSYDNESSNEHGANGRPKNPLTIDVHCPSIEESEEEEWE